MDPEYGETWVYESIIGALPGIDLSVRVAIGIQFAVFEASILLLAWYYGFFDAAIVGTVAVVVAVLGSVEMLRISAAVRRPETPESYQRLLFGSNIEVVLSVLAFIALVTHLFVFDVRSETPLVEALFGPNPPIYAVYVTLLVLWDLCYRIGTGWWASVTGLWRSVRYRFDADTAAVLRRVDRETILFAAAQLLLLPFLTDQPVLFVAVSGHVVAVTVVSGASLLLLRFREH
jgi:hypothetical protein